MTVISRAIPGLFGGVSQQFPAMRHPTQGEIQDNALSTVVDGLYKRPGSTHIGFTPLQWNTSDPLTGNAFIHVIDRGDDNRWGILLDGVTLKVVNMTTGAAEAVSLIEDPSYLTAANPQASFRCVTVADTTFVVNTNTVTAAAGVDPYVDNPYTKYLYIRTVAPQQTYYVTINGTVCSFTSGTTTNIDTVTTGLMAAIVAAGFGAVQFSGVTGLVQVSSTPFLTTLVVSDTFGNSTMQVLSNGVQKFSDLPPRFGPGIRIKIAGSGPNVDPYYVEWTGTQWTECRAPGVTTGLNELLMPHKLARSGAGGTWEFRRGVWDARKVGDDDTNPNPSFVGRRIRDIFFHRNRLGILSGDTLCMSRSGLYFNFFATTATDVLDTDPIDLGGSAENIDTLDWAVPFNLELIVWATSKQQFSLASGDVLSPNTARLVPTTAFSSNNAARPKQLGNRIIYANTTKGFSQLGLYRISKDTVSNTLEAVTDHVPNYVPDNPRAIEVSESFRVVAVLPPDPSNELYIFKYEDDGEKLTQRAWQRFTFEDSYSTLKVYWANSKLYLFNYYRANTRPGGISKDTVALEVIDFSTEVVDTGAGVAIRLDRKVAPAVAPDTPVVGQTTVTVPFRMDGALTVLQSLNGYTREFPVISTTLTDTTTVVVVRGTWSGGSVVVGRKFLMRYRLTEIFMRDAEGVPIMSQRLKLLKVLIRHIATGFFKVLVKTKALGDYTYQFTGEGVGFGLGLGTAPTLVDGDFNVPIHAPAAGTTITIESDSFLPCSFPYAEWRGNLVLKAKR